MTLRTTKVHRTLSILIYAFVAGAGASAVAIPPVSMRESSAHIIVILWSLLMFGGGLAGLYSSITDNILPEMVGIPALLGAVMVFLIVLASRIFAVGVRYSGGSVVLTLLLLSFSGLLLLRFFELRSLTNAVGRRK
jgi:hypothetical protein